MAVKAIGEVFSFNAANLGETLSNADKVYHEVFDKLQKEKRICLEQMCLAFSCAAKAYRYLFKFKGDTRSDVERICQVGGYANQYFIHIQNLRDIYKTGNEEVLDTMDKVSDWLIKKGWYGLPEPNDETGTKVYKTAKGVYNDMKDYSAAYRRAMAQLSSCSETVSKRR